jgi:hypothetical protein
MILCSFPADQPGTRGDERLVKEAALLCGGQYPGRMISQTLSPQYLAVTPEMIEYQSPVRDEASVALQPVGLLPGIERPQDGGSLTQFGFNTNACTDERFDAKRCSKPAHLVEVEVAAAKETRDVDDS